MTERQSEAAAVEYPTAQTEATQVRADLERARAAYRAAAMAGDATAMVDTWRDVIDRARQLGGLTAAVTTDRVRHAEHAAAAQHVELTRAREEEARQRAALARAREGREALNSLDPARYKSAPPQAAEALERTQAIRLQTERQASDAARGAAQARADAAAAAALAARATRSSRTQEALEALEAALGRVEPHRGAFFRALADAATCVAATRQAAERAHAATSSTATWLDRALLATQGKIAALDSLNPQKYQLESQILPLLEGNLHEARELVEEMAGWVGEATRAARDAAARRDQCIAQADLHLDLWLKVLVPTLPHAR